MTSRSVLLGTVVSFTLVGCSLPKAPRSPFEPTGSSLSTNIRHVVLIKLKDAQDADDLIHEMDALLTQIPAVSNYWRGSPFRTGRPEVQNDFDVGMTIDFRDSAAYDAYASDPRHIDLVTRWKPRCTSLTILDIAPKADFNLAHSKIDPYVDGRPPPSPAQ